MYVLDVQAIQLMESDDEEENDGFPVEIDKQVSTHHNNYDISHVQSKV